MKQLKSILENLDQLEDLVSAAKEALENWEDEQSESNFEELLENGRALVLDLKSYADDINEELEPALDQLEELAEAKGWV